MNQNPSFYSVIIGSELLNGRRKDAHFAFLNEQLLKRGWTHKASFVIADEQSLIENTFKLIQADENSVMFCFGGIGATPDDLTRQIAGTVFTNGKMEFHEEAKRRIEDQFSQEAYPHRVNMAYLPINAKLLDNVVNNVAGFYLDNRFFFTPGFPSMSQSMIIQALNTLYPQSLVIQSRYTLTAHCGENDLIPIMKTIPSHIDFSSLPKIIGDKRKVVISVASHSKEEALTYFERFTQFLDEQSIVYELKDTP
jgi:molybdopterin-biosynthesis enzyme MoeA-like protein